MEQRWKIARHRKDLTLAQVAEILDKSITVVRMMEANKIKHIEPQVILKAAELYEVNPSWLIGADVPMNPTDTVVLTPAQKELLKLFNQLSPANQQTYLAVLQSHVTQK